MKKRLLLSLLGLLFAAGTPAMAGLVTDHGAPFYTSVGEGQAAATKAGSPMIVKFYTEW